MDKTGISQAFEVLIEEFKKASEDLSKQIKEEIEIQDFSKTKVLSEMGEKLKKLAGRIKEIKVEWQNLSYESLNLKLFEKREKLRKGLKTKQEDYFIPILEALLELGGSGSIKNVLEKVYEKMKNKLNKYDLDPLPSDPKTIRWKNTAQWARNEMTEKGLLSSKSQKGIWEITEKGKDFLKQKK